MLGLNPTDMAVQQANHQIMLDNQMMIDNNMRMMQQMNEQIAMQNTLQKDTFTRSACILPPKDWKPDPFAGLGRELSPQEKLKKKWEDLRKPKYMTETPAQKTEQEVESFDKVFKEFSENVPDTTKTVKEKTLALGYISRIQNSDACDELKEYWDKKSQTIQKEIKNFYKEDNSQTDKTPTAKTPEKKTFTENVKEFISNWGNKMRAMSKYCLCRMEK